MRGKMVARLAQITGDLTSTANWWILVNALTTTERGERLLVQVTRDFDHELQRAAAGHPEYTRPDNPGAVLNARIRKVAVEAHITVPQGKGRRR